jgi:hypothetical protein
MSAAPWTFETRPDTRTTNVRLGLWLFCPVCFDATGLLTDGARAGAAVLALVLALVLGCIGRFARRLYSASGRG